MLQKETLRVVAAVIKKDGKYLITQRNKKAFFPLFWEFPGGKVEKDEKDEDALVRELKEEMEIDVKVLEKIDEKFYEYSNFNIYFVIFRCSLLSSEIKCININDYRWVKADELSNYKFPPADEDSIKQLIHG